jgi:hypothetical protein
VPTIVAEELSDTDIVPLEVSLAVRLLSPLNDPEAVPLAEAEEEAVDVLEDVILFVKKDVKLGVFVIRAFRVAVGAEVGVRVCLEVGVKLTLDVPLFDTVLEGEAVLVCILEPVPITLELVVFVTRGVVDGLAVAVAVLELKIDLDAVELPVCVLELEIVDVDV